MVEGYLASHPFRVLAHTLVVSRAPERDVPNALAGEMTGERVGRHGAVQVGDDAATAFLMKRFKMLEWNVTIRSCVFSSDNS